MKKECEGWRRRGTFMTFGPVKWEQCKEKPIVILTVKQEKEKSKTLPACLECWEECIRNNKIRVLKAEPFKENNK